jgi:predicted MFS family arabinose efflux permease
MPYLETITLIKKGGEFMETRDDARAAEHYRIYAPSVALSIFVAALVSFACNLDKFIYPPIIPLVVKDVHLSFAQAGFLMGVIGLVGIFVAIPGGIMISRIGIRTSGVLGLLITALGSLIIVTATNYWLMVVGRGIAGAAERLVMIVGLTIIGVFIPRERNAFAQGVFSAMIPISVAISGSTMGFFGNVYGWRSVFSVSMITQVVIAVMFYLLFIHAEKPGQKAPQAGLGQIPSSKPESIWNNAEVWKLTIIWGCFQGGSFITATWFPMFLKETLRVNVGVAALIASIGWWVAIISSIVIGWLSDLSGRRKIWIVGSSIAMAICAFILPLSSTAAPILVLIVLAGLFGSILPPTLMAMVPEVVKDKRQIPQAFGILSAGLSLALFIAPTFAGWLRDMSGAFTSTLYLMACLSIVCAVVGLTLKTR